MAEYVKEQSNSFSTAGGGVNFETRVQAAFTVLLLTGGAAPCFPDHRINKLVLQGRYAGFNTDDAIVFLHHLQSAAEAKLLAQMKHDVAFTEGDKVLAGVIQSFWHDLSNGVIDVATDAFALITGPLSATDINDVRAILEWARTCTDEQEFFAKINTPRFGSEAKRRKLEVFRTHLRVANNDVDVSDKQVWEFLKLFHLIGYDLDAASGSLLSFLLSLIEQRSSQAPQAVWSTIVDLVQTFNQNAGTITLDTLPANVRTLFDPVASTAWSQDIKKFTERSALVLDAIEATIGGVHVDQSEGLLTLLELTESSNFVFVTGARGVGKSSLIKAFSDHVGKHAPVFCLRTEELGKAHLDHVFSAMGLSAPLTTLEKGFAMMPKKYLLLESFEKLLELGDAKAFTDLLTFLKKQSGWTIVATGREYAYQQIMFNYLQPHKLQFTTLEVDTFSDAQVQTLCQQLPQLEAFAKNPALLPLLETPFFAKLALRVLERGATFTPHASEQEFKTAVWNNVIANVTDRSVPGMAAKRRRTFINIALQRAKRMIYGVSEGEFEGDAIDRLEHDHLIWRDFERGLVSPAHDVLEDWALEAYIEESYQRQPGNARAFLDAIGHEPAMNRAFRLWLQQKLRVGAPVKEFVRSVLTTQAVERYWQDETIAAILLSDNPGGFLELLTEDLFANDAELLRRFCFVLRIACQTPSHTPGDRQIEITQTIKEIALPTPYGQGWQAMSNFALENKARLSPSLARHITGVLDTWAQSLTIFDKPSELWRQMGLLALHLLQFHKGSYRDNGDGEKLLSIILKTAPAIHEEFAALLERDVLVSRPRREGGRPRYADTLCEMALSGVEVFYLAHFEPVLVIRLARFEWMDARQEEDDEEPWYRYIEMEECFGLDDYRYKFYPPSGLRGPFHTLLRSHPIKGLEFLLAFINSCATKYAHSNLDAESRPESLRIGNPQPLIGQVELALGDGTTVKQFSSQRLWLAYRGHHNVPSLLESALMALENHLVELAEASEFDLLERLFGHIMRESNSVMTTAVLVSLATGFPDQLGKTALPMLRVPAFYDYDLTRRTHEDVGRMINEFASPYNSEPLKAWYAEERQRARGRPWRSEDLTLLMVKLQMQSQELGTEAREIINHLRTVAPSDPYWQLRLHRMDIRNWEPVAEHEDKIMFSAKEPEPKLQEKQRQNQSYLEKTTRFLALNNWAKATYEREANPKPQYATWQEALSQAKALFEEHRAMPVSDFKRMTYGAFVTAAAVFIRDYSHDLSEEDFEWCRRVLVEALSVYVTPEEASETFDVVMFPSLKAAASVLPIVLDFAQSGEEKRDLQQLLIAALTCQDAHVRHGAAEGVRLYLGLSNPEFAQRCFLGAVHYARFEAQQRPLRVKSRSAKNIKRQEQLQQLKAAHEAFQGAMARGEVAESWEALTLEGYDFTFMLTPCLMIPYGSREENHVTLLSSLLDIIVAAEQDEENRFDHNVRRTELPDTFAREFMEYFADYLYPLHEANFAPYLEQLKRCCELAPSFMNSLILQIAVKTEVANNKGVYWKLWKELSPTLQAIARGLATPTGHNRIHDKKRELLRTMLHAGGYWTKVDFENQDKTIALGKPLILEFVDKAGQNADAFEALASLMFYFPELFLESGIPILARHQEQATGTWLLSGTNTVFYLERTIARYLRSEQSVGLTGEMHRACLVLLNAVVETASATAYYLREYLMRSRRIS
jgi:hypothetical protein